MEQALKTLEGVKEAEVNLAENNVTIEFDPSLVTFEHIKEAIEGAGYDVG